MKQFETIKNRQPRGIDLRISSKNILSFRVSFQRNDYSDLCELYSLTYLEAYEKLKLKPRDQKLTFEVRQPYKPPPIALNPPTLWVEKATVAIQSQSIRTYL